MATEIDDIHAFWFGPLDEQGMSAADKYALWFNASEATDHIMRERFRHLVDAAVAGELTDWEASDRGLVALVLLLDQFTRNIYRGSSAAFAGDARALALAQNCIARGHHQRLPAIHQVFLFLPLEHSEDLEVQEECVELFQQLASITGQPQMADFTRYAEAHRDTIARFGRFPHRNSVLRRESSEEERQHLDTHGGF